MQKPNIQDDDADRIRILNEYKVSNSDPEQDFQEIAELAKDICNTDVALISFIDEDTQWFKAHPGTEFDRNTRELALCSHAINVPYEMTYVPDTREDERYAKNPMVTGPTHVHFYAGIPLLSPEGFALGTLCVMHTEAMVLSEWQKQALLKLSNQVLKLLELRRLNYNLETKRNELQRSNGELREFASAVSHDIKGPLGNILNLTDLLQEQEGENLNSDSREILSYIKTSSEDLFRMVTDILSFYSNEHLRDNIGKVDVEGMIKRLTSLYDSDHELTLKFNASIPLIQTNETALKQIFSNLISNALKYNDKPQKEVEVESKDLGEHYQFKFSDNGIGIPEDYQDQIFKRFKTTGTKEQKRPSSGLGLALVKKLIDHFNGEIAVDSKVGEGTTFIFTIQKPLNS